MKKLTGWCDSDRVVSDFFFLASCKEWFFYFILFYFPFIFISWRLITLQYCSGFCDTLTWISHGFTCIYSPSQSPLPHPSPPDPSGSSQCTSPEHLTHASNLGWWSVSSLIIYMGWLLSWVVRGRLTQKLTSEWSLWCPCSGLNRIILPLLYSSRHLYGGRRTWLGSQRASHSGGGAGTLARESMGALISSLSLLQSQQLPPSSISVVDPWTCPKPAIRPSNLRSKCRFRKSEWSIWENYPGCIVDRCL